MPPFQLTASDRKLIELALQEDIGTGDVTTRALFQEDHRTVEAKVVAKEPLILAGIEVAYAVFRKIDPKLKFKKLKSDGDSVVEDSAIALLRGSPLSLLSAERVALNFIQHLSGVATLTRSFVEKLEGTRTKILDTRKTLPGWRRFEKYAVLAGGGTNHRMGLYDAYLVKDNHLALAGSIPEAVRKIKAINRKGLRVEVEVENLRQFQEAITAGVDWVMLDNMSLEDMRLAVIQNKGKAKLEASGNITVDNIRAVAKTGVDFISVGALTHSARAMDVCLEMI